MSETKTKKSVFETLNAINVNEHVEQRNGLTYLSWAWAWQVVKQNYPDAFYTIYENKDGLCYHTDGNTAWVKTGVTIEGLEHIEYLPVMDNRHKSIPVANLSSFDANKAIQRSLTKACARHGLGLYVYAGEDLPDEEAKAAKSEQAAKIEQACAEMRAVKSREEFETVWRKWCNAVPRDNGSEFMNAVKEMAAIYPKPQ